MRRALMVSAVALVTLTSYARAQGGIKLSDVAGTWITKSMVGPKDSVVTTSLITAAADDKGWRLHLRGGHEPVAMRIVAIGGDSIVTEAGPFESVLRPGQTVTVLRGVGHYKGDAVTGTFEAHYASGDVLKGKTAGTRKR
jgi:hypothetical protein